MSQVGDTSNPSPNGATPRSNSRSKVASSSSTMGDALSTKRLKFNEHGLPVGENSATPSTRLGDLARTHVPVSYTTWRQVDARYKNQIWTMFKVYYFFSLATIEIVTKFNYIMINFVSFIYCRKIFPM